MFSVIIPLYNKAPYVRKAIESVMAQTYRDFELIIVDDGSTDNSLEVVKIFMVGEPVESSPFNIHLITQPNQGVSTARNNGVAAATRPYIAFLDADDWWDPHFLEEMKSLIEDFPDAGVYGCSFFIVKNGVAKKANVGLSDDFTRGYINYFETYTNTWCTPFNCSFVVISKGAYSLCGGFNPVLKFGEDFDLWVRIALQFKVGYTDETLAFSNQDVELSNRALGADKIYPPEVYSTFNLDYLATEEKANPDLKKLLDGLRVRSLIRYHLTGKYITETKRELAKVDWNLQPRYYHRLYRWPLSLVRLWYSYLRLGVWGKSILRRLMAIIGHRCYQMLRRSDTLVAQSP